MCAASLLEALYKDPSEDAYTDKKWIDFPNDKNKLIINTHENVSYVFLEDSCFVVVYDLGTANDYMKEGVICAGMG